MRKLTLGEWASVAEIVGMFAVVASVLFLVYEVKQNTSELQYSNENAVYDRIDSLNSGLMSDPELASLFAKKYYGLDIPAGTEAQFVHALRREINQWEQYYWWHENGIITTEEWKGWDAYYIRVFKKTLPYDWWNGIREYTSPEFAIHVDDIYD